MTVPVHLMTRYTTPAAIEEIGSMNVTVE